MTIPITICPKCGAKFIAFGGTHFYSHEKRNGQIIPCEYQDVKVLYVQFPLTLPAKSYLEEHVEAIAI